MLKLDVTRLPKKNKTKQDTVVPSRGVLSETRKDTARPGALPSDAPAEAEKKREAPAAPKVQFDFYEALPDMEEAVPEEQSRAQIKQAPSAALEAPASLASEVPAEVFYLQVGSFRNREQADRLMARLTGLGFRCKIREATINDTDVFHRVRVGPFTDSEVLDKSRRKLGELGIESQVVKERE